MLKLVRFMSIRLIKLFLSFVSISGMISGCCTAEVSTRVIHFLKIYLFKPSSVGKSTIKVL